MKKVIKSLLGALLALVMCLAIAPTQTAKAEISMARVASGMKFDVRLDLTDVDETETKEEQLLTAYMGTWDESVLTKEKLVLVHAELAEKLETAWNYQGTELLKEKTSEGKDAMALKFADEKNTYYVYKDIEWYYTKLMVEIIPNNGDAVSAYRLSKKVMEDGRRIEVKDVLTELLVASGDLKEEPLSGPSFFEPIPMACDTKAEIIDTSIWVGESYTSAPSAYHATIKYADGTMENHSTEWDPKVGEYYISYAVVYPDDNYLRGTYRIGDTKEEYPETDTAPSDNEKTEEIKTEEPKEDVKTDGTKEVIEKTKDGRDVYAGESVYIVKRGDCLWAIAQQLLGNGSRYPELFTRNNGIIEKAELIYPDQEVIIPAK